MNRADGERERARNQVVRLRAHLDALHLSIDGVGPPGVDAAQAITQEATSLAMTIAKLDAYVRASDDAERARTGPACTTCDDTHRMTLRDAEVMCTRCPTPCHDCAGEHGRGGYCATTPCRCECHARKAGAR